VYALYPFRIDLPGFQVLNHLGEGRLGGILRDTNQQGGLQFVDAAMTHRSGPAIGTESGDVDVTWGHLSMT
jgi:hypothetical protein